MLSKRWATALTLLAGFLACLFLLPQSWWVLVMTVPLVFGAREWGRLSGFAAPAANGYALASVALAALVYVWGNTYHVQVYLAALAFWLVVVPLWLAFGWRVQQPWLRVLSGWLVLLPLWLALVDLRAYSAFGLLLLMGIVWIADSAAYFTGKRFGRRRLAAQISPGKTWEGAAGAWLAVTVYATVVLGVAAMLGRVPYPADWLLPLALFVWLLFYLSILGDLFESWIKRLAGAKDSSDLLPGHGGMLDRIDALTSTLPIAALMLLHGQLLTRALT
ncbi:phosphatidate cytidylyltransferase [Sulfuriferula plumbiphila]|uniref:Phosphatidate cytidylyltransferase n=1 Tax=Sulfuriferula plumbiphila TaxID=171865 RepID=A0A512L8E8_9PROT|nr:phosphatidate cytidylyltransferase [Sulfuriferula plumbiphila]BBP05046.1 phosphatidate cytidylyltransferase [Sulfuriferula plumbiphila]GEP30742.1 phosphatidate cytidylyltransferase [Sulfuriferula plumbiphila]